MKMGIELITEKRIAIIETQRYSAIVEASKIISKASIDSMFKNPTTTFKNRITHLSVCAAFIALEIDRLQISQQ